MTNYSYKEDIENTLKNSNITPCNDNNCDCDGIWDPWNPVTLHCTTCGNHSSIVQYCSGIISCICSNCESELLKVLIASKE